MNTSLHTKRNGRTVTLNRGDTEPEKIIIEDSGVPARRQVVGSVVTDVSQEGNATETPGTTQPIARHIPEKR